MNQADTAAALQREGRFAEAEAAYRAILAQRPGDFDALHLLGVLCLQTGRSEEGIGLIGRAVEVNPAAAVAHKNRAMGLANLGRDEQALASCDRAVERDPGYREAWTLRGYVLLKLGRTEDGLRSYVRAVKDQPNDFGSANADGEAYRTALASLDQAIAAVEGSAGLYARTAAALAGALQFGRAVACYDKAIGIDPGEPELHCNRALALFHLGRYEESAAGYGRAVALDPKYADAYVNRGAALFKLGRYEAAVADCDTALALQPNHAKGLSGRGICLQRTGRAEEALESFDRAIEADPGLADAHLNRAIALESLGRTEDAEQAYHRAIELNPAHIDDLVAKAHDLLLRGKYEEGWRTYEWRKQSKRLAGHRRLARPEWLGKEDPAGRHLFVYWEQGHGDLVQMARYLKVVRGMGARVTVAVPDPMVGLMQGLDPGVSVLAGQAAPEAFDFYCSSMSLPLALGTTLDTIPVYWRYLHSRQADWARWETRLGPRGRPRVGIVWRGNPTMAYNRRRSLAWADLQPMLGADVRFICLQHELDAETHAAVRRDGRIEVPGADIESLTETAALVDCLDLVISVDTFFAHLAGAMGKPVWVLLPTDADWRWLTGRADSPWYPSARLFRQQTAGDWAPVVARVRDGLDRLAKDIG